MTRNANADERTDEMKIEMAKTFQKFEAEYRGDDHTEIVHEDDQVIVVADHGGHELREWAAEFDVGRTEFASVMHDLARQVCDYNWSAADPVVFEKIEE